MRGLYLRKLGSFLIWQADVGGEDGQLTHGNFVPGLASQSQQRPSMEVETPVFKRKKSRPSRQREAQSPDPAENNVADKPAPEFEDSPMTLAAKLKAKHKARAKPQARLSFGVEEDVSSTLPIDKILQADLACLSGRRRRDVQGEEERAQSKS